ncbi:MAG TPA: RagB/SusD family nutrient uptake outer membrane protein [Fodinibius sp.]|nr:RagB/SusD family nutrient uptake outer membrane protein [Fodinibius sp.]
MLNKIFFSLVLVSTIFISSCDDNFLGGKPLDQVSDSDIWQDISMTQTFVDNIYGNMRTGHEDNMSFSVSADESYQWEDVGAQIIQRGDVTPSDLGQLDWTWEHYYEIIAGCNRFTSKVTADVRENLAAQDQEQLNRMTGEIKTLRAFAYHRLSSLFGGVPLIITSFSLNDDFKVERSSYEEVVDFIVSELDEASNILPVSYSDSERGRITKGAALAIKSRVLLYAASSLHNPNGDVTKWQVASDAAKDVINLDQYSLYPDYGELFTEEGNFNNESIWELVINNESWQQFALERNLFPNGSGGWAVTVPTQNQVDAYETKNGLLPKDDPSYNPQNPWVNRDPRFYDTILYNGAPWRDRTIEVFRPGGADSPDGARDPHNASRTGYYTKKFVDENWAGSMGESSSPNWMMIRYAEILLNYAEAQFHLGNEGIAREYVNMVRSRPSVDMPDVTESGSALLDRIKNERRVEFYLEEHRFFDVRRWTEQFASTDSIRRVQVMVESDGETTISYSGIQSWKLPEHTYLLPIPQDEILSNPALNQNPGY